MDQNVFLENVRRQFDETDPSFINMETNFCDVDEWCSLIGLALMAMVKDQYGVKLSLFQLKSVKSVNDLYNIVTTQINLPIND